MSWLFFEKLNAFFDTLGVISWTTWQTAVAFVKGYADYTSNVVSPILSVGTGLSHIITALPSGIWIMLVMLMIFTIVFIAIRIVIDLL